MGYGGEFHCLLMRAIAVVAASAFLFAIEQPAGALTAKPQGAITGTIVDSTGGLPIVNARVELDQGGQKISETFTGKDGSFSFRNVAVGPYAIVIEAAGFERSRLPQVVVAAGQTTDLRFALRRVYVGVRQIGTVLITSGGRNLQTSSTINQTVPQQIVQAENFVRGGDVLGTLPGITASTSNAVGDDVFLNIRGYNASESATLLDGHQVGPLGSAVNAFNTYDSQVSPFFGYRGIQVTYGSGATGLYGVDTIAGTIDYQTIDPTLVSNALIEQGVGNDGKLLTGLQMTGTEGKVGYALAHAVEGTYGNFAPQIIHERGLLGTNLTSTNINSPFVTYNVSGDYNLRNDLAKIVYNFDYNTKLQLTTFAANSWEDKTGNGDQDYLTYQLQLYDTLKALAAPPHQTSITLPNGSTLTCTNSVAVNVDAPPGGTCLSPTQFARESSGPAGGGPGPWQDIRDQDYDARLIKTLHNNTIVLDGYVDNYGTDYNRAEATKFFRSYVYVTHGLLVTDDIATSKNDFGFGYSLEHQEINHSQFPDPIVGENPNQIRYLQPFDMWDTGYFVNDQITPNSRLSFFINLWLKHANVTPVSSFDPRVSVMYRPTDSDVLRITSGHSASVPQPALVFAAPSVNGNVGAVFPNCSGNLQTDIGSVPDRNLRPERATDYEFAYGHRFNGGNIVQLNLYDSEEQGALFDGTLPFTAVGNTVPPAILQLYLNKIKLLCPNIPNPTLDNLSVDTTFNAAAGRYRGIELSGREHVTRDFFVDYLYDTQSAAYLGVPDSILQSNFTVINGAQIYGIPLHKYSIGLEYAGVVDVRFDNNYMDQNNSFNHPPFWWTNASISKVLGTVTLTAGVNNLFNSAAASPFGLLGLGTFQPENQFGTDTSALSQGSELYGLPARQFMFTVQYRP